MEIMNLIQFLREKTDVCELCIIREDGWRTGAVWIDNEDLWIRCISSTVMRMPVKGDSWGVITIINAHGEKKDVPCHYIDI